MDKNLQDFIDGYIEAALWSTSADRDDSGKDDASIGTVAELAAETSEIMTAEATTFYNKNKETIEAATCRRGTGEYSKAAQAGHDFWLTRCGHGAGFWDGDWSEPHASHLTYSSKIAGERDLYIGDDGLIYQM